MFKVATIDDWWDIACKPEYKHLLDQGSYLKRIGYLFVIGQIEKLRPKRILEFGHARSPLFQMFGDQCEMWGVDDDIPQIPAEEMEAWRNKHEQQHNARFIKGKVGEVEGLPDDYFDLVCSVSVVEHIPLKKLNDVYNEIARTLKPGGWTVGSYDVRYGRWTKPVFKAHLTAGLEWADPKAGPVFNWNSRNACFEDGRHILQYYMWRIPEEEKAEKFAGNCASILMRAYKPDHPQENTSHSLAFRLRELLWETNRRRLKMPGRPSRR